MASLTGNSRSGGKPNWNYYIVDEFDKIKISTLLVDKDGILFDNKFNSIFNVKKGEELKILSKELTENKNSKFALIKIRGKEGFLSISNIRKPTNKTKPNLNSKEYTPDKLHLQGIIYSSVLDLHKKTLTNFRLYYKEEKYENIIEFADYCMSLIERHTGTVLKTESLRINQKFLLPDHELKILSKNFGEVLAALYVLKVSSDIKEVSFPSDISQQLFDFSGTTKDDLEILFSVKAGGGSSTSMDNINFIIKTLNKPPRNKILETYKNEIEIIQKIINNKEKQHTTLTSIETFFKDVLPNKQKLIVEKLNSITPKNKIADLSQESLNKWFLNMKKEINSVVFSEVMNEIYNKILGDLDSVPKTTGDVLEFMFNQSSPVAFKNGYLYYPMGSYIVKYLNNTGNYKKVLTTLLNMGSNINQVEVNLTNDKISIKYSEFKGSNFRFSYNGMSKKPDNRPLGFKME